MRKFLSKIREWFYQDVELPGKKMKLDHSGKKTGSFDRAERQMKAEGAGNSGSNMFGSPRASITNRRRAAEQSAHHFAHKDSAPNGKGKKRIALATGIVAVAVLVPVLAAAANGNMGAALQSVFNPVKATEQVENVEPQETADMQEPVDPVATQPAVVDGSSLTESTSDALVGDISQSTTSTDIVDETQPEATATPEPKQYKELVPDTNHADVVALQQRLMELHYMDNDEPTDFYGPATKQAVGYFQRKHGLTMDGAAGAATQDILFSNDAKEYSVTVGADGPDVEGIQQRLQELGYPVEVTSYFGTETDAAVKYFQRMNSLTDDGSVGYNTKEILFSKDAEAAEEYVAPTETPEEGKKSDDTKKSDDSADTGEEQPSGSSEEQADPEPEPDPAPAPAADPGNVEAFVNAALAQVGKSYVLGGKGPNTFDCSGLVYYALNASGNGVGYMTSGGWRSAGYSTIGSVDELQRGDVICMSGHVGIYLGGGRMVDASSSNGCVVEREVGSWARSNFICGKRPLG